jgi:hypothetical protein
MRPWPQPTVRADRAVCSFSFLRSSSGSCSFRWRRTVPNRRPSGSCPHQIREFITICSANVPRIANRGRVKVGPLLGFVLCVLVLVLLRLSFFSASAKTNGDGPVNGERMADTEPHKSQSGHRRFRTRAAYATLGCADCRRLRAPASLPATVAVGANNTMLFVFSTLPQPSSTWRGLPVSGASTPLSQLCLRTG